MENEMQATKTKNTDGSLSLLAKLLGQRGGKSRSEAKIKASRRTIAIARAKRWAKRSS